jgi:hypothetical protein
MANFSISTEAEKWPPFPRLKSRGPIEADLSGVVHLGNAHNFHG